MSVDQFPLSETDFQVINASEDHRKRVSVAAGPVSVNYDYAEDRQKYESLDIGESFTADKAVAVRGPGRIFVTDYDPIDPQGEHPDTEEKIKRTTGATKKTSKAPAAKKTAARKDDRTVKSEEDQAVGNR